MSVYNMKPLFKDWNGYRAWQAEWKQLYEHLASVCKARKIAINVENRKANRVEVKRLREKYIYDKVMAAKMLTLRHEGKIRWTNIKQMYLGIRQQYSLFPLAIEDARNIDFHFNKKHLEFPEMPMWSLKAKGVTYSIRHLDCEIPWSTKEKPGDSSTKGMIRIKRGNIYISSDGEATIRPV